DDKSQQSSTKARVRGDDRAVAVLPAVADLDQQRERGDGRCGRGDGEFVRYVAEQLAQRDGDVTREAAPREAVGGEVMRDARVQPDAGNVEEQAAIDLARVDDTVVSVQRDLECGRRIERDAEITREAVARTARDK